MITRAIDGSSKGRIIRETVHLITLVTYGNMDSNRKGIVLIAIVACDNILEGVDWHAVWCEMFCRGI